MTLNGLSDSIVVPSVLIVLCALGEAFFSGSEMALVACDKIRLRLAAESGNRGAQRALALFGHPARLFSTTLLGTNLCLVTSTTIVTLLIIKYAGPQYDGWALLLSPILLIFAEIVPKNVFRHHADRLVPRLAFGLVGFGALMSPIVWLFSKMTTGLMKLLNPDSSETDIGKISRDELRLLLRSTPNRPSDIHESEKKMISRIFDFSEKNVRDMMIPLIEVFAISDKTTVAQALLAFIQKDYSRLPVYHERVDNLVGILHHFDLFDAPTDAKDISSLIRAALYVAETEPARDVLLKLKRHGSHLAIVVDEYGGSVGIVTIEDILEEIVGEIDDEYDTQHQQFQRIGPNTFLIHARIEIEALNDILAEHSQFEIPEGDYETLGGFLMERFLRIPQKGETIDVDGYHFEITKANERSIIEAKLTHLPSPVDEGPSQSL